MIPPIDLLLELFFPATQGLVFALHCGVRQQLHRTLRESKDDGALRLEGTVVGQAALAGGLLGQFGEFSHPPGKRAEDFAVLGGYLGF